MEVDRETDRMRLEKRLQHDVPLQFRKDEEEDPHAFPFEKKQRLFENLAKQLGAPSPTQEVQVRHQLEEAAQKLRKAKQEAKGVKQSGKLKPKEIHRRRDAAAVGRPATPSQSSMMDPAT